MSLQRFELTAVFKTYKVVLSNRSLNWNGWLRRRVPPIRGAGVNERPVYVFYKVRKSLNVDGVPLYVSPDDIGRPFDSLRILFHYYHQFRYHNFVIRGYLCTLRKFQYQKYNWGKIKII